MEKIVYVATLPIMYNGGVLCNHKLGTFAQINDAEDASKIVRNILSRRKDLVEFTEDALIKLKKVDAGAKVGCYKNIEDFLADNIHTQRYATDRGQEALDVVVNETLEAKNALCR